ncbi:glycine receptor subunit alpha-2-like [Dermacentor andersoni]|uniref:glycine receptor subunit alpha-2-like n=1 Tax=Dermacentor andersoni TaxID=34620 RepID=UPI002416EF67|nr:glycine receptor subunit alpha-2-like [Dermacentor andersoni]
MVGTYVPSALLVVCSWPAFWLATTERLSLCGTLLLALTRQSATAQRALPPSVALTTVDWWMSGCIGLVLAVIVETTAAYFEDVILPAAWRVHRVMPREAATKDRPDYAKHLLLHLVSVARPPGRMDAVACLLFPGAFLLFNACYWASMYGG